MKFHNLGTLVIQDNYGHGEIEMLEILAYAEKIIRHGIIQQAAAIADLGVENLACRQGFVLLDQVKQIIRKHIISAPHNVFLTVRSAVGVDGVGLTENGSGFCDDSRADIGMRHPMDGQSIVERPATVNLVTD